MKDAIELKRKMKKHFSSEMKRNDDNISNVRARYHVKYTNIISARDYKKKDRQDRKESLHKVIRRGLIKDKFKKLLRIK